VKCDPLTKKQKKERSLTGNLKTIDGILQLLYADFYSGTNGKENYLVAVRIIISSDV
jgi:hypothetical protein